MPNSPQVESVHPRKMHNGEILLPLHRRFFNNLKKLRYYLDLDLDSIELIKYEGLYQDDKGTYVKIYFFPKINVIDEGWLKHDKAES